MAKTFQHIAHDSQVRGLVLVCGDTSSVLTRLLWICFPSVTTPADGGMGSDPEDSPTRSRRDHQLEYQGDISVIITSRAIATEGSCVSPATRGGDSAAEEEASPESSAAGGATNTATATCERTLATPLCGVVSSSSSSDGAQCRRFQYDAAGAKAEGQALNPRHSQAIRVRLLASLCDFDYCLSRA